MALGSLKYSEAGLVLWENTPPESRLWKEHKVRVMESGRPQTALPPAPAHAHVQLSSA